MRPRKGQAFLPDFLASIAIFGAITAVFLFSWNSVISNQGQLSGSQNMRTEARYTTTFLVSTPGYPQGWNSSNVEIPGFASEDNVVQQSKIKEFSELDYESQKRIFTVENFLLEFREDGSVIEYSDGGNMSFGEKPVDPRTVTPVTRDVLLESSGGVRDVEMVYIVWE